MKQLHKWQGFLGGSRCLECGTLRFTNIGFRCVPMKREPCPGPDPTCERCENWATDDPAHVLRTGHHPYCPDLSKE